MPGVGHGLCGWLAQPAVRAEVNPMLLNKLGVGLNAVRNALNLANANQAKGEVSNSTSPGLSATTTNSLPRISTAR